MLGSLNLDYGKYAAPDKMAPLASECSKRHWGTL